MFTKLNDYLNSLEKLKPIAINEKKELVCMHGYTIEIKTDFLSYHADDFSVQVVLRIHNRTVKNISFFGSTGNKENSIMCKWFFTHFYRLQNEEIKLKSCIRQEEVRKLKEFLK